MTTTIGVIAVSICLTFIFTLVIKIVDRANRKEVKLLEQENSFNHDMMVRQQALELGAWEEERAQLRDDLFYMADPVYFRQTPEEQEALKDKWRKINKRDYQHGIMSLTNYGGLKDNLYKKWADDQRKCICEHPIIKGDDDEFCGYCGNRR